MNNFSFKVFGCFISLFLVFFATDFAYAGYQKIAPGDTVTLGEFVFDDNFVPTTTPCTIGITDPGNIVVVASTTPMIANNNGWHYYNYTTAGNAPSGVWPSVMICGSAAAGDLVKVDKGFIVENPKGYTVTLSNFVGTTVNTAYKAKLQVLNSATTPTDADSLPTVVITDSAGTVQVPAGVMTKDSAGTYSYSFSIPGIAVGGVWETVVSVVINGKTVRRNDYWSLSSSPADVNIIEITKKIIPTITANVRIDNKGTSASDFYYVYCIVNSVDKLCGAGNVANASATVFINAGGFTNLSLTLNGVSTAGTYWFKVKARALAEPNWAAATRQFIAESGAVTPPPPPPSGGGGGGGGGGPAAILPPITAGSCNGADFNHDGIVNSIDFSILLFFWKTRPTFRNPCVDINKDQQVNSVDFSILLYQWGKPGTNISWYNLNKIKT